MGQYDLLGEPVSRDIDGAVFTVAGGEHELRAAAGEMRNATDAVLTGVVVSLSLAPTEGDVAGATAAPCAKSVTVGGRTQPMGAEGEGCRATVLGLSVAPNELASFRVDGIEPRSAEMLTLTLRPLFGPTAR